MLVIDTAPADLCIFGLQVFDQGDELGFSMRILDIGGGFAGGSFDASGTVQLGQVPLAVNSALATFFPDPRVKVQRCPHMFRSSLDSKQVLSLCTA